MKKILISLALVLCVGLFIAAGFTTSPAITLWGRISGTLSDQADLQAALDSKLATNATLSALSTNTITGSGTIPLSSVTDALQPLAATLTSLATNTITGTGTIPLSSVTDALLDEAEASALYQATNAALTALSADPSMYQATNATLTALSTNNVTGTGTIPLSSVTDALQPLAATLTAASTNTFIGTGTIPLSSLTDTLDAGKQPGDINLTNFAATATADASGNTTVGGTLQSGAITVTNAVTTNVTARFNGPSGGLTNIAEFASGGTNRVQVTEAGGVGIGTTPASGYKLHAKGGDANTMRVDNDGTQYTQLDLANNGVQKAALAWDNNDPALLLYSYAASGSLTLGTLNTARLRITSTGSVGIGTTAPAERLHVSNGTNAVAIRADNTYTDASNWESGIMSWSHKPGTLWIGSTNAGTGVAQPVDIGVGGVTAITVATNGSVTISSSPVVTEASANTFTNKTFDADGAGNVLKQKGYIVLTHPHSVDGTGAIFYTNDWTNGWYGQASLTHSAATNANYIEYRLAVPEDIDTAVDLKVERWKFWLSAADTGSHQYYIGMLSVADSASGAGTPANYVSLAFAGDGSGAQNDIETVINVTLTDWKSNLTAGQFWIIRVQRGGDEGGDTSTVNSYSGPLVISYGKTQ